MDYAVILAKVGVLRGMPALYDLLEIQPTACNIMVTNRCNLKCMMCRQWKEPSGEELSSDEWKRIISDLRKNGIKNLHFTGGEPLLRKDLPELVRYANDLGFTVGLTTNGMLLTRGVMDRLIEAGLRSIVISIDALNGSYDKIRGAQNAFPRVKESARLISEARRKEGIDVSINFTLMKGTIDEFVHVKKFADGLALPIAICLLDDTPSIFRVDRNRNEFWISEEADLAKLDTLLCELRRATLKNPRSLLANLPIIEYIKKYFKDPLQKNIPCASSQDRIVIDPYGNFLGGCLSMGTFGNIKKTAFGILRREKKYKIAKRNMFYKNCPGCSCGYGFNIKCLPGLMLKDLAERSGLVGASRGA